MRILSVQVPDFRALKHVDLLFDPSFQPQVFPIGSNNGGGKSTLLQLIFLLLTSPLQATPPFELAPETPSEEKDNTPVTIRVDHNDTVYEIVFSLARRTANITQIIGPQSSPIKTDDALDLLHAIANKVYLLSPERQPFLWGTPTGGRPSHQLPAALNDHFMAYEWLTVEFLLESFRYTRDADFVQQRDHGRYGDRFAGMLKDLQDLLPGKKVQPNDDFSAVKVILPGDVEIGLGDLSRGELQRLTLYAFFQRTLPASPVVLMDEVEGSAHRDWQEGIVRDLTTWAPDAQFLLATHSHEICESLTPAHIIDLQP